MFRLELQANIKQLHSADTVSLSSLGGLLKAQQVMIGWLYLAVNQTGELNNTSKVEERLWLKSRSI